MRPRRSCLSPKSSCCHDLVVCIATPLPLVHGVETATGIVLEQSTEELHATPMYRAVFGTETAQSEVE